ncbi:MAG: DUF58 domain-containing protein, partial [Thermoplasmata archaeon]|nr:DUF58 domain-containing protein [Thermoplasmata archaeon]
MISRTGAATLSAALAALLLSALLLNYILILVSLAVFVFLASEVIAFHLGAPALRPELFRVRRAFSFRRVPIDADASADITVTYDGARPFWGEAYDTLPSTFRVTSGASSKARWWTTGTVERLHYRVRVRPRGSHQVGPVVIVAHGPLGLCFQETVLPSQRPLLVTPTSPILRPGPAALALYTRVRGRLAMRHRGYGTEFRSLRAYQLSDDIRHIAWRRSTPEQLMVREFEQESRQDYLLVVDASDAMLAGVEGTTALDRAVEAGVVVAGFVERTAEDRIGLMTFAGGKAQFLRPGRGSRHFRQINDNLALVRTRGGDFVLADLLADLARRLKVHTHVLVFSTLSRPLGDLGTAHLRFTARGHHLYMFGASVAGFYPTPPDDSAAQVLGWALGVETDKLQRRFAQLHAEGIPTFTFDQRGATQKVIA